MRIVLVAMMLVSLAVPARAEDAPVPQTTAASQSNTESSQAEVVWEWDPYYTDVGYNIPLTSKPIPTIVSDNEAVIYSKLIEGSLIPRYMVLEASVYPMPVLGIYLNTHTPGFYKQGDIGNTGINIFESATAGFQEPWAVSAFFGNVAKLERPGETRSGSNLGYTGYLVSAGTKQIKDNVLIADDWYELEWKIKGKLNYPDEKMDWSFRVGAKNNSNTDIVNVVYFSVHRSNMGFRFPFASWLWNSDLDAKFSFSQNGGRVVREEFVVGKKYPLSKIGYTPSLDFGLVWDSPDEYAGVLRNQVHSTWTLVFRPSVEF